MGPDMQFSGPDLDVLYTDQNQSDPNVESSVPASLKTNPYDLPLIFRMGAAYDFTLGSKSILTVVGEMHHPNDHSQQGGVGAELGYSEQYFLRGGYKINYDEESLSFGAGVSTDVTNGSRLIVDYSWQDLGRLQSSHRFSVGFSFF